MSTIRKSRFAKVRSPRPQGSCTDRLRRPASVNRRAGFDLRQAQVAMARLVSTARRRRRRANCSTSDHAPRSPQCPGRQGGTCSSIVVELYDLLSVCCFRRPLLGSSYPPCDSNTPRSARVPHRSGPLRQSQASAARAKPEPNADLGSARANRHR